MIHQPFQPAPFSSAVNERALRVLDTRDIEEVSGGFVCGGLCVAGLAFGAGALFGSGVAIGYHTANK